MASMRKTIIHISFWFLSKFTHEKENNSPFKHKSKEYYLKGEEYYLLVGELVVVVGVDEGDEEAEKLVENIGLVGIACQVKVERDFLVLEAQPAVHGVDGDHEEYPHNVPL